MKIYLVGGAVRDALLNIPVVDRDWVVVGATPDEMIRLGFRSVGKDFPVFLHPNTQEEYALARTEKKNGKGYLGFECYSAPDVTLKEDLLRRDLTINAIAQDFEGNLIDPYQGKADLDARLLRHVSTAFSEDPLRVLRVARFAARYAHLGFRIAEETFTLMRQMALSGELNDLTAERVWKETERALAGPDPDVYFRVLHECEALGVLFPELEALFGVPAPAKWHPEVDTGLHTLLALKVAAQLSEEVDIRFAALCHDVGKGLTPATLWPRHPGHGAAGIPLIDQMCDRLRIPNHVRELAKLVAEFHDVVHTINRQPAKVILRLLDAIDVWRKPYRLEQVVIPSEADLRGRTGWENNAYPQGPYLLQSYHIASRVSVQAVIDAGFQGRDIRDELNRRRLEAIQTWQQANSAPETSLNAS